MTKQQLNVKTFMQTFNQETPEKPTRPSQATRALRVKLLLEEVLELAEASGIQVQTLDGKPIKDAIQFSAPANAEVDLVGVADALADIDYVNQGAAVAYGLDLEPFCDEVHSSNMTKLWSRSELPEAEKLGHVVTKVAEDLHEGDKVYLVKRIDGKVVKSPSYKPADLNSVLQKQI